MEIKLSKTIEILLLVVLVYILILRGALPELMYQGGLVAFIIYYFLKKYTSVLEHDVKIPLPEYFDFLDRFILKKVNTESNKFDKVEKFLSYKNKSYSLSYSDLSEL